MNVKGHDGNINNTGKPFDAAEIFPINYEYFWDMIEDNIKPLVKVIINLGFETYSSCEGHYHPNEMDINNIYEVARVSFKVNQFIDVEPIVNKINNLDYVSYLLDPIDDFIKFTLFIDIKPINRDELNAKIIELSKTLEET
jgi:hypothetical protein